MFEYSSRRSIVQSRRRWPIPPPISESGRRRAAWRRVHPFVPHVDARAWPTFVHSLRASGCRASSGDTLVPAGRMQHPCVRLDRRPDRLLRVLAIERREQRRALRVLLQRFELAILPTSRLSSAATTSPGTPFGSMMPKCGGPSAGTVHPTSGHRADPSNLERYVRPPRRAAASVCRGSSRPAPRASWVVTWSRPPPSRPPPGCRRHRSRACR